MRILLILLLFLGMMAPTHATPPRVIYVEEHIAGQTADQIFIFRRVTDNLGLHHTLWTDLLLIGRDNRTGAETGRWPVMSVLDNSPWFADYGQTQRTRDKTPKGRIDPFAFLAERGAWQILPGSVPWLIEQASLNDSGIEIVDGSGGVTHRLGWAAITKSIAADIGATEAALEERPTHGGGGALVLPALNAEHCKVGAVHRYTMKLEPYLAGHAVRLDCSDEDEMTGIQVFLIVPPVQ